MELDKTLWEQALNLEKDCIENGDNVSWTKISNELLLPERLSRYIWFALKNKDIINPCITKGLNDNSKIEKDFEEDKGVITTKSLSIRTVKDAIEKAQVDLDVWEVYRNVINSWEVTMGADKTASGRPETYTNYQVKIWLRKKIEDVKEKSLENIINKLNTQSLTEPKNKNNHVKKIEDTMVIMGLVDSHFGMLAYNSETGEGDFDLEVAEKLYSNAVEDALDKTNNINVKKIVIPIGNDFFHINNVLNRTPKGNNPLDVSGLMSKIFQTGEMAVIKAVEKCISYAPVELIWVPGNHDPEISYFLCKVLHAYYRNNKYINVDISPKSRKFIKWGTNLIGFSHGSEEPIKNLPHIMVDSCPEWIGKCKNREWLIGHIHKKKEMNFVGVDSLGSTIVRVLPSLSSIDKWHYDKGYVGKNKTMEMYAYDKNGMVGYFPINARE